MKQLVIWFSIFPLIFSDSGLYSYDLAQELSNFWGLIKRYVMKMIQDCIGGVSD
jgi:hypothetical protein